MASEQPQAFNYIDEDTFARLRNVGTRVRKSVTEGYARTVSVPADAAFGTKRLPFTQTPSFISSNDVLRNTFAAQRTNASKKGSSSVPSSPQQRPKRAHDGPDEDSDVEPIDDEMNLDLDEDEDDAMTASAIRAKREAAAKVKEEKRKREIRPFPRSKSRGMVTQSLPPSMFSLSHEPFGVRPTQAVAKIAEEDDWSESFGASGGVPSASLVL